MEMQYAPDGDACVRLTPGELRDVRKALRDMDLAIQSEWSTTPWEWTPMLRTLYEVLGKHRPVPAHESRSTGE